MRRRTTFALALATLVALGAAALPLASAMGTPVAPAASSGISFTGPTSRLDTKSPAEIFPGGLYLDTTTDAAAAVTRLSGAGRIADAGLLRQISERPTAVWLGEWFTTTQLKSQVAKHVAAAKRTGTTPVFVTYAIPNRDCGGYSAGGLTSDAYLEWNRAIATSLNGTGAVVIVEPDALSMLTGDACPEEKSRRLTLMKSATGILANAGLSLYLDAGHSNWVKPEVMADLLRQAGIDDARGFVTNVSNYRTVADERIFGDTLSKALGGKSYAIDVSRNGTGWQGDWCNPTGAAIGQAPSVADGSTKLDALLWVKHPGQSDGTCNGGPSAGAWWESYALDLVRNQP